MSNDGELEINLSMILNKWDIMYGSTIFLKYFCHVSFWVLYLTKNSFSQNLNPFFFVYTESILHSPSTENYSDYKALQLQLFPFCHF